MTNDQQLAQETLQLEAGKTRYLKRQDRLEADKGFSARDEGTKLIRNYLSRVSKYLKVNLKTTSNTKSGYYLNLLDSDLLALIALSGCLNAIRRNPSLNKVTTSLGRSVETEVWALALKADDKKLYERLVLRVTKAHGSLNYRKKAIRATAAKEGYAPVAWAEDLRAKVGEPLLNAVLITCPEVFETYLVTEGKASSRNLGLTEGSWDLLTKLSEDSSWLEPVFAPMTVPPVPWTKFNSGAYLTPAMASRVPLVRTHDGNHISLIKAAIADGSMTYCLEALNAIQDTKWAINGPIYDLVNWCWETKQHVEGLPIDEQLPRLPRVEGWEDLSPDQRKAYRIQGAQIAQRNRGIDSDRVNMLQDLGVAKGLLSHRGFYIPHNLDFRGRVYPVPAFNPQRSDYIRAMFQFSTGKPLGDQGAYWLAIHLANTGDFGGVSKRSLEDRFAWTIDNEGLITEVANDPFSTIDTWKMADKPFQFVVACIEYQRYLEQGDAAISFIPVALDGSNSGLQHYSASLRSLEGALVNLVPQDTPADLYQAVADIVSEAVAKDAKTNPTAAMVLSNGITRKLVKRNAMTFSYSSGEYGFKQQHMEDLMRPLGLKVLSGSLPSHPYDTDGDQGYKAAGYIAKSTYKAITSLVKDATAGMRFFQQCAAALSHEGKGLTWVTPIGLPVLHHYTDWDSTRVKMFLHDRNIPVDTNMDNILSGDIPPTHREVRLEIRTKPSKRINKAKAKSAVSPNVIHSMDGSHLMLTVLKAKAQGITNFSLIHDSFGTHAADTNDFFYIIREAFVEMYQDYCPYQTIYNSTLSALDDKSKAPQTPKMGTLNVNSVYSSLYAFA